MAEGFLAKVQRCLGLDMFDMAKVMGLRPAEYKQIRDLPMSQLADFDMHPMWDGLNTEITERMGGLMAAHSEIRRKMGADRKARIIRTAQAREIL